VRPAGDDRGNSSRADETAVYWRGGSVAAANGGCDPSGIDFFQAVARTVWAEELPSGAERGGCDVIPLPFEDAPDSPKERLEAEAAGIPCWGPPR
jgi:hypothetical protein